MTIKVVFCYERSERDTRRAFDSFEEAAHYAIGIANDFGSYGSFDDAPAEVQITEDDHVMFAIKVLRGGLTPSEAASPPAISPALHRWRLRFGLPRRHRHDRRTVLAAPHK